MREARKRNLDIILDALPWGAPGWIGGGEFYSQDMAGYVCDFLEGAQTVHGLDINFVGIWNERHYNAEWIKLLRCTLDARGLQRVRIVAADANTAQWAIAEDILHDPELAAAVDVIGEHYTEFSSSPVARKTGKRLWDSEDGPWRGDWQGAMRLAKLFNRNYANGRMTKTVIWSLVSAYYDNLPLPGSGLMTANTPWSGAFEVQPALWAVAHTTQFSSPGWHYLDGDGSRLFQGGSVVGLVSPDESHLTLVFETMDAAVPMEILLKVPAGFEGREFCPWLTVENEWFKPLPSMKADAMGGLRVELPVRAILTLSTIRRVQPVLPESPPSAPFPSPYHDDFSSTDPGKPGRFLSDQGGGVEVVAMADGSHVLRQQITRKGIEWQPTPDPETLLGDPLWKDQSIEARARFGESCGGDACLAIFARVGKLGQNARPAPGYALRLYQSGKWEVCDTDTVLESGVASFAQGGWHVLKLEVIGDSITAMLGGRKIAFVRNDAHPCGLVGLGCGYHSADFADLRVTGSSPRKGDAEFSPAGHQ